MIYTVSENDMLHQYGFQILKNQAIPGNIFLAEEFVDGEMLKAAKEEIKQEYEGVKKAGRTMILGNSGGVTGYQYTAAEELQSRCFLSSLGI